MLINLNLILPGKIMKCKRMLEQRKRGTFYETTMVFGCRWVWLERSSNVSNKNERIFTRNICLVLIMSSWFPKKKKKKQCRWGHVMPCFTVEARIFYEFFIYHSTMKFCFFFVWFFRIDELNDIFVLIFTLFFSLNQTFSCYNVFFL